MSARLTRAFAGAALTAGLLFGGTAPLPAVAASTLVTASESLNVRAAPSTSAQVIGGLYRGQTVTGLSAANGWTKITYPGVSAAYVTSSYLTRGANLATSNQVNAGAVRTTTTNVNLRKGAGLSYGVIKVLKKGLRVTLTGRTALGFTQVVNGGSTGWVSTQYLTGAQNGLPTVIGTRVATTALAIRTSSGADAKTVAEVNKGTRLGVTGATANGRAQIVYNNAIRWVTAKYLANPASNLPARPTLPRVTGIRYATTTLNIRSTSTDSYTRIATVARGTRLSITSVVKNGRMQIVYGSAVRWVTAKYLSTSSPATPTPVATPPPGSRAVENGLKPNAIKTYRAAIARFPQITTVYGVRQSATPDHPAGRAIDLMIPNYKSAAGRQLGTDVAAWARTNAKSLGINYVIYDQRIWNVARDQDGWRYMAGRGNDSANHKDHVHITVYAPGSPGS